jgi:hypothetical protein
MLLASNAIIAGEYLCGAYSNFYCEYMEMYVHQCDGETLTNKLITVCGFVQCGKLKNKI